MSGEIHLWAPGFAAFGGGVAAFSRELALALAEKGTVHLLGKHDIDGAWGGLPLRGSGSVPERLRTVHFTAILLATGCSHRPRLIVSTHVHFGPAAQLLRRAFSVPYVLVAHGIEIGPDLGALRRRALSAAASVWAVSRWTRERLLACGLPRDRIRIVPNTVPAAALTPSEPVPNLRARHSINREDRVLLAVARLDSRERYKGHDQLLRALPAVARAVGPLRCLIVGTGDDEVRLRTLAAESGVERLVTFCGFVPDHELPAYYDLADAFAMPSTGEGFGVVFLEAMARGTPVLGGNRDGTRDALADGELGLLVDPESVDSIAQGLVRLLSRRGPALWFDREKLRKRCLEVHGREAFRSRVREALYSLEGAPTRAR